nr:unnamed protein product [Callosobruchus analis]
MNLCQVSERNGGAEIGNIPIFQRDDSCSLIDVTFASQRIAKEVLSWSVLNSETLSDHNHILIELKNGVPCLTNRVKQKVLYDKRKLLNALVTPTYDPADSELHAEQVTNLLKKVYRTSCLRRGTAENVSLPFWWALEIEAKRNECIAARRKLSRLRRRRSNTVMDHTTLKEAYQSKRKELKKLIRASRKQHWQQLRESLENDIWGDGYRIVSKTLIGNTPFEIPTEKKLEIINDFFPKCCDMVMRCPNAEVYPFTTEELNIAAAKL